MTYFARKRIEGKLDAAISEVIEPLEPLFSIERLGEDRLNTLCEVLGSELYAITSNPTQFFQASLDGRKLYERRYAADLPERIVSQDLSWIYSQVFPSIANVICLFPPALDAWKAEGEREVYARFDEITLRLKSISIQQEIASGQVGIETSEVFSRVLAWFEQKSRFELDLTGLRGDRPDAVPIERCFIFPALHFDPDGHLLQHSQPPEGPQIEVFESSENWVRWLIPSRRTILIGPAGSGKSTVSKWLQSAILQSGHLAILIKLRDVIAGQDPTEPRDALPSLMEIVKKLAGVHLATEIDAKVIRSWLTTSRVYLLLDGFDEVPPDRREVILDWIQGIAAMDSRFGILVTSRPISTNHLSKVTWARGCVELRPFDSSRIVKYIDAWYRHAPLLQDAQRTINADELAETWVSDPALLPLVQIPLTLATVLMVHHLDGELPQSRSMLYRRYVDGMLGLWDSRGRIHSPVTITRAEKKNFLTKLAIYLQTTGRDQIGDKELMDISTEILIGLECSEPIDQVIVHIQERSALLIGPGTWSFVHKSVGEYLVAEAIVSGNERSTEGQSLDRLFLFDARQEDRWAMVVIFWAGLCSIADLMSFVRRLVASKATEDQLLALALIREQLSAVRLTKEWCQKQTDEIFAIFEDKRASKGSSHYFPSVWPKGTPTSFPREIPHFRDTHRLVEQVFRLTGPSLSRAMTGSSQIRESLVAECCKLPNEIESALLHLRGISRDHFQYGIDVGVHFCPRETDAFCREHAQDLIGYPCAKKLMLIGKQFGSSLRQFSTEDLDDILFLYDQSTHQWIAQMWESSLEHKGATGQPYLLTAWRRLRDDLPDADESQSRTIKDVMEILERTYKALWNRSIASEI